MKVLSLKEPFATLIMNGTKKVETRSWKTNYRGEILIHASLGVDKNLSNNKEIENYIKDLELNCGYIICRANLVDCICMDEEYVKKMQKNIKEYCCGDYQVGRYAWILEDVYPIVPIKAKGHLNIWNYDGTYELII